MTQSATHLGGVSRTWALSRPQFPPSANAFAHTHVWFQILSLRFAAIRIGCLTGVFGFSRVELKRRLGECNLDCRSLGTRGGLGEGAQRCLRATVQSAMCFWLEPNTHFT